MTAALRRRVLEIVRAQRRELLALAPARRRAVVAAASEVQRDLLLRMQAMNPASFTAQQTRMRLVELGAIVDSVGRDYGAGIGSAIEEAGTVAAELGREPLIAQLEAWAPRFRDSIRRTGTAAMAGGVLDDGLLEDYQASRATYGLEAIQKMRAAMSRSALAGETLSESWVKISQAIVMPEWRAERIVRTEQSFAASRAQLSQAGAMYGEGANTSLRKQLVATFDGRTGDDSRFVHEQVRKLDEDFEDDRGRRYPHPPNRPNDREVMVIIPAPDSDFERILAEVESLEPADRRPLVERELAEARERMQRREAAATPRGVGRPTQAPASLGPNAVAMGGPGQGVEALLIEPSGPEDARAAIVRLEEAGRSWAQALRPDEAQAVTRWTDDWRPLRRFLVDRKFVDHDIAEASISLTSALKKAPKWTGPAFRGYSTTRLIDDKMNSPVKLEPGQIFTIGMLRAFSRDLSVAVEMFAAAGRSDEGLVVEVVNGSRNDLAFIAPLADPRFSHQREVLSMLSGRFRILPIAETLVTRRLRRCTVTKRVLHVKVEGL